MHSRVVDFAEVYHLLPAGEGDDKLLELVESEDAFVDDPKEAFEEKTERGYCEYRVDAIAKFVNELKEQS